MMAIALSIAAAAAAQDNPFVPTQGIRGLSQAEWRYAFRDYGICVVSRYRKLATAVILDNVDDETLVKHRKPLPANDCLKPPKMLSIWAGLSADRVRYAIADALVRSELKGSPAPDLSAVPKLSHLEPGPPPARAAATGKPLPEKEFEEASKQYREQYLFAQFSRFGECVVRTNPAAARDLLLTEPESVQEGAAFGKVKPAMANCLIPGETMALTKLPLRGTIAVNYYRLSRASGERRQ